jgi:polysaccharide export outer membrane protein
MAPVRVVRAFRIPMIAIIAALALSGCMRTTGPVAVASQGDLDSMAYGQPNSPPPQAVAADSGGGAIGAVRAAFAAAPAPVVAAAPVAYVEPMPVRYDAAYHLDAGDRLRVVVYGQEGLTNTYAIDPNFKIAFDQPWWLLLLVLVFGGLGIFVAKWFFILLAAALVISLLTGGTFLRRT